MSTHVHDWRGIDTGRMCAECGEIDNQLRKLPTVEQIRDIVQPYSGNLIDALQIIAGVTAEQVKDAKPMYVPCDYPSAAIYLSHAKDHLLDTRTKMTKEEWEAASIKDLQTVDAGDAAAWWEINFVQQSLWSASALCQIPMEMAQHAYACGRKSDRFCQGCGADICEEHSERVNQGTYCLCCGDFQKRTN